MTRLEKRFIGIYCNTISDECLIYSKNQVYLIKINKFLKDIILIAYLWGKGICEVVLQAGKRLVKDNEWYPCSRSFPG